MAQIERPSPTVPVSADRSLLVRFELLARRWQWGASGAFVSGVAAAAPRLDGAGLARVVAAWFVVVPLLGAAWAPFADVGRRTGPKPSSDPRPTGYRHARRGRAYFSDFDLRGWRSRPAVTDAAVGLLLALAVAWLISPEVVVVLFGSALAIGAVWLLSGRPPPVLGPLRSVLEILVPALIGWLAMGGARPVPAPTLVNEGLLAAAAFWLRHNWLVPGVFSAFTLIFHGATAVNRRDVLADNRRLIILGYVLAIGLLAATDRPLGAGAVALIFVAQWPFQAAFQLGYVHWHWRATHMLAFAAMFAASVAAR